jgi:acetyl esterase/lipase
MTPKPLWIGTIGIALLVGGCGAPAEQESAPPPAVSTLDADGDGVLTSDELPQPVRRTLLQALDVNEDEALTADELALIGKGGAGRGRYRGSEPPSWEPSEEEIDGVRVVHNVDYATGPEYRGGRGKLDLYLPLDRTDFPVLVFFHGGGLTNGDKGRLTPLGVRFVKLGYGVVFPNYRLSPEWYYPAYVEDAAAAFKWTWDHIGSYGGDRERITVSGGSAGGHITGLLSLNEVFLAHHGLSTGNITVSIPITGMMDATTAGTERIAVTYEGDVERAREASPIQHVRDDAPPMLLMVADGDTELRRQQNIEMFEAMQATGHPSVVFRILEDRTHGSIFTHMLEEGDPTVEFMLEFMEEHGGGVG